MKCPMCLGKGYATDEDIKEYPHRCPNCNGKGFYSVDWQKVRCEVCNGSGKKPMTNFEWLTESPERLAEWLAIKRKLLRIPETNYEVWMRWLKEKHDESV